MKERNGLDRNKGVKKWISCVNAHIEGESYSPKRGENPRYDCDHPKVKINLIHGAGDTSTSLVKQRLNEVCGSCPHHTNRFS